MTACKQRLCTYPFSHPCVPKSLQCEPGPTCRHPSMCQASFQPWLCSAVSSSSESNVSSLRDGLVLSSALDTGRGCPHPSPHLLQAVSSAMEVPLAWTWHPCLGSQ